MLIKNKVGGQKFFSLYSYSPKNLSKKKKYSNPLPIILFKANRNTGLVSGKILLINPAKNILPITKSGPNDGLPISLKLAANKKEPKNGDRNKDNTPIALFE
jgi:hypothetical protein